MASASASASAAPGKLCKISEEEFAHGKLIAEFIELCKPSYKSYDDFKQYLTINSEVIGDAPQMNGLIAAMQGAGIYPNQSKKIKLLVDTFDYDPTVLKEQNITIPTGSTTYNTATATTTKAQNSTYANTPAA